MIRAIPPWNVIAEFRPCEPVQKSVLAEQYWDTFQVLPGRIKS
jgi:hypothetical protein